MTCHLSWNAATSMTAPMTQMGNQTPLGLMLANSAHQMVLLMKLPVMNPRFVHPCPPMMTPMMTMVHPL